MVSKWLNKHQYRCAYLVFLIESDKSYDSILLKKVKNFLMLFISLDLYCLLFYRLCWFSYALQINRGGGS